MGWAPLSEAAFSRGSPLNVRGGPGEGGSWQRSGIMLEDPLTSLFPHAVAGYRTSPFKPQRSLPARNCRYRNQSVLCCGQGKLRVCPRLCTEDVLLPQTEGFSWACETPALHRDLLVLLSKMSDCGSPENSPACGIAAFLFHSRPDLEAEACQEKLWSFPSCRQRSDTQL